MRRIHTRSWQIQAHFTLPVIAMGDNESKIKKIKKKKKKWNLLKEITAFAKTVRGAWSEYWQMAFPLRDDSHCPPARFPFWLLKHAPWSQRASSLEAAEELKSVFCGDDRQAVGVPIVVGTLRGRWHRDLAWHLYVLFWHWCTFMTQVGTKPHPFRGQGHCSGTRKGII